MTEREPSVLIQRAGVIAAAIAIALSSRGCATHADHVAANHSTPPAVVAAPPTTVSATTAPAGASDIRSLADRLGSDDPAVVSDAKTRILALGPPAISPLREQLRAAAEASKLLDELDLRQLLAGTPVTLKLTGGTLKQAAESLTRQTRIPIALGNPQLGGSVTCDFNNQPFWSVISALCEQCDLAVSYNPAPFRLILLTSGRDGPKISRLRPRGYPSLSSEMPRRLTAPVLADPMMDDVGSALVMLNFVNACGTNGNGGSNAAVRLDFKALFEPKVKVCWHDDTAVIKEALDDHGNAIPTAAPRLINSDYMDGWSMADFKAILPLPEKHPESLSLLRGSVRIVAGMDEQSCDVFSVLDGKPLTITTESEVKITLDHPIKTGDKATGFHFNLASTRELASDDPGARFLRTPKVLAVDSSGAEYFLDATTTPAGPNELSGTFSTTLPGKVTLTRLTLQYFGRLADLEIPFEFKDVPLP